MLKLAVVTMFAVLLALPVISDAQGNDCSFPGQGIGVGGTPGQNGTPGTFPGGGATGGVFPGGNCGRVSTPEPATMALVGLGLGGAAFLARRRRRK